MNRDLATKEVPLLNRDEEYIPDAGREYDDDNDIVYNADAVFRKKTHITTEKFNLIYNSAIRYFTVQEKYAFKKYMSGEEPEEKLISDIEIFLKDTYPNEMGSGAVSDHDFKVMMNRLYCAMFQYDVLQPLIENEETSDIKICGPKDIRVRVHGKAYISNATFIDDDDLNRFVEGLSIRNRVAISDYPIITFTDTHDENYILRFTISNPSVCAVDHPYLHIRKVPKTKADFDELIKRKMLNEKVKMYLIDRAKASKCVVFAGPPGSGKTTALNAFIEHIPRTRETLVIQENDELFTDKSGFMFKHVSHGFQGEPVCTLEDLGKMALVEGCNEFVIGEVKGGEMRYAVTLLNAGGNAAFSIHSTNAYETLEKCADLVKYGSDYSFEEAKDMLKNVDTIVYMEGYKIREILENKGYNQQTKQYEYVYIYRYDPSKEEE